ncbi:MAG TPA: hypothetical protein VKA74_05330, partial [Myxococcota bacterium]|nr:hypothetical protein [Myxococcota bacterium]
MTGAPSGGRIRCIARRVDRRGWPDRLRCGSGGDDRRARGDTGPDGMGSSDMSPVDVSPGRGHRAEP